MSKIQYTIRGIPEETDKKLRQRAERYGKPFNTIVVETLNKELFGVKNPKHRKQNALEKLWGANTLDEKFDEAIKDQSRIDPKLWV